MPYPTYDIATETANGLLTPGDLHLELEAAGPYSANFLGIQASDTEVTPLFDAAISGPDQATVTAVVAAHQGDDRGVAQMLVDAAAVDIEGRDGARYLLQATSAVGASPRVLQAPSDFVLHGQWSLVFAQEPGSGGKELTFDPIYTFGDEPVPDFSTVPAGQMDIITFYALSPTLIRATLLKGS